MGFLENGVRNLVSSMVSKWMAPVDTRGSWFPIIQEPYAGAWQRNDSLHSDNVLSHYVVYSCISLISGDIAKLPFLLKAYDKSNDIWVNTSNPRMRKFFKKPNIYQNGIQFREWWITSKLIRGNAYGLKIRDRDGQVVQVFILDPDLVQVLVTDSGDIYYQLSPDNLSGIEESIVVPAEDIIHDRMCCLFHPLVGVSPLYAGALAAMQGLNIQSDSSNFFSNQAMPGGVLSAPGNISDATAKRMKDYYTENFTGKNAGKLLVVGDGLQFKPMKMSAVESDLIAQLRWTDAAICAVYHVPAYKVPGVGATPTSNNAEALTLEYYEQCLQILISSMESCFTEGMEVDTGSIDMRIELDLDQLFRMDSSTLMKTLTDGIKGTVIATNEARKRFNLPPVEGGDSPMSQQQNYSLAALAERDRNSPLLVADNKSSNQNNQTDQDDDTDADASVKMLVALVEKGVNDAITQ